MQEDRRSPAVGGGNQAAATQAQPVPEEQQAAVVLAEVVKRPAPVGPEAVAAHPAAAE